MVADYETVIPFDSVPKFCSEIKTYKEFRPILSFVQSLNHHVIIALNSNLRTSYVKNVHKVSPHHMSSGVTSVGELYSLHDSSSLSLTCWLFPFTLGRLSLSSSSIDHGFVPGPYFLRLCSSFSINVSPVAGRFPRERCVTGKFTTMSSKEF